MEILQKYQSNLEAMNDFTANETIAVFNALRTATKPEIIQTRDKKGRFELAHGGTIFLDEISDLSLPIQASLLRVLQDGTFERVGGEKTIRVDARVISATNNFLERLVAKRKFREDLYYRLCVVPITVPPLRDRLDDLPLLAEYLAENLSAELGRSGKVVISPDALDLVMGHSWPGNIRELRNAIHYALVKCKDGMLKANHFPPSLSWPNLMKRGRKRKLTAAAVERALDETDGNKMAAARKLGVCRATLYKHLERES